MRVAEERHDFNRQAVARRDLAELAFNRIESDFRHLEQHETTGGELHDLAAQLGADRAAGASDENAFPANTRAKQPWIRGDGVTAEQVAHFNIAQLVYTRLARDQIGQVGK